MNTKTRARELAYTFTTLVTIAALAGCSGGGGGGGGSGGVAAAAVTSSQNIGRLQDVAVAPASSVTIDNDINAGFQIVVDAQHQNATIDVTRDATYVVENTGVATISGDGLITPVGEGNTNIAITYEGRTTQVAVSVVAPDPLNAPNFVGLTIYPETRNMPLVNNSLGTEQFQQLVAVAEDDTGRLWDITRTAPIGIYDENNQPTLNARISPTGLLRGIVSGEVIAVSRVASAGLVFGAHYVLGAGPDATPVDPNTLFNGGALASSTNPIDQAILTNLFGQLVEPAAISSDGEFQRRLYADLVGRTPTEAEVEAFAANSSPTKREAEIDTLLATPAFAAKWAGHMGEWFQMQRNNDVNGNSMAANAAAFDAWAETGIAAGTPLSGMVSELATGQVGAFETQHDNAAKKVDILLLAGAGMSAACAQCHDHPLTGPTDTLKWTQIERYGLDSFFATSQAESIPLDKLGIRSGNNGNPVPTGFALDPNATVTTTLADAVQDRRNEFASLFTSSAAFNRGMGHRIFATVTVELLNPNQFLEKNVGAVLVPNVLDTLQSTFAQDTSLKGFLRTVTTSGFYQLSSAYADTLSDELLSRRPLRRHHAEVMNAAVAEMTGMTIGGNDLDFFRQVFGFPFDRESIGERVESVNMSQSFLLMNSPVIQDRVSDNAGNVAALANDVAAGNVTMNDAITSLFETALARTPTANEIQCAMDAINGAPTPREGLEDVAAVLMSTVEFVMR